MLNCSMFHQGGWVYMWTTFCTHREYQQQQQQCQQWGNKNIWWSSRFLQTTPIKQIEAPDHWTKNTNGDGFHFKRPYTTANTHTHICSTLYSVYRCLSLILNQIISAKIMNRRPFLNQCQKLIVLFGWAFFLFTRRCQWNGTIWYNLSLWQFKLAVI